MTSTLEWFGLPSIYPELKTWGAFRGAWQYVMTFNTEVEMWRVSAKLSGEGQRIDLGIYDTRAQAEAACRNHAPDAVH